MTTVSRKRSECIWRQSKKNIRRQINTNIDFEFKSPVLKGILTALLILLIIAVFAYQFYARSKSQKLLPTETALDTTVYHSITVQAAAVRSETVLNRSSSGTVVPMVSNGSKVAINDAVAKIYANADDAKNASVYSGLTDEIKYYEAISAFSDSSFAAGADSYNQNVTKSLIELQDCVSENELSELSELLMDFRESVTKKQIAVGMSVDVAQKLQQLYAQLNLLGVPDAAYSSVTAPVAGYYVNTVDGYENIYDMSSGNSLAELTPDDIDGIINASPSGIASNVGKLITEFNWYFVCVASEKETDLLDIGDNVKIAVDELGGKMLTMKLKAKNIADDSRVALVFSCNVMNSEIASLRFSQIRIILEEFNGYPVSKTAVRTVNGETGVYVQLGKLIRFRKIEIIYSDESKYLAKIKDDDGYLKLYDEVIIEGIDNDDGKIIV